MGCDLHISQYRRERSSYVCAASDKMCIVSAVNKDSGAGCPRARISPMYGDMDSQYDRGHDKRRLVETYFISMDLWAPLTSAKGADGGAREEAVRRDLILIEIASCLRLRTRKIPVDCYIERELGSTHHLDVDDASESDDYHKLIECAMEISDNSLNTYITVLTQSIADLIKYIYYYALSTSILHRHHTSRNGDATSEAQGIYDMLVNILTVRELIECGG
ncbi:hypothetical protein Tco_1367664 [Tanacetum coccineum]